MSETTNTHESDQWVSKFDAEVDFYWEDGMFERVVAAMLKDFLLSTEDTATSVAHKIDSLYDEFLEWIR